MKKAFAVIIVFSFALLTSLAGSPEGKKLVLCVSSSSGKEISFVSSTFMFPGVPQLDQTLRHTPYEIAIESNYVNAMVVKTSGEGDLIVDLVRQTKSGRESIIKASSPSAVVVGTRDADKRQYYQHPF